MGIDETDIARLLAGDVSSDDAQLGQVSAFLGDLKATFPPSSISAFEDRHLAVVAREVRAVDASRLREHRDSHRSRVRLRRTVAAFGAGVLAVLTAGVGVASAMGLNPLELVPGLVARPSATPDARTLTPVPSGNSQHVSPGTPTPSADPSVPPTTTGQPSASPTHGTPGNCGNGKGAGNATCTHGKSGKEHPRKDKSSKDKSSKDKSGKDKSGKGNSGSAPTAGSGNSGNQGRDNSTKPAPSTTPTADNGKSKVKDKSEAEAGRSTRS